MIRIKYTTQNAVFEIDRNSVSAIQKINNKNNKNLKNRVKFVHFNCQISKTTIMKKVNKFFFLKKSENTNQKMCIDYCIDLFYMFAKLIVLNCCF